VFDAAAKAKDEKLVEQKIYFFICNCYARTVDLYAKLV
jgi:hypothetical protein